MENNLIDVLTIFVVTIIICSFLPTEKKFLGRPIWHYPKSLIDYELDGPGTSQQVFDIYSFSHITHGIILYYVLKYLGYDQNQTLYLAVIAEILWEIFENTPYIINKYRKSFKEYQGDSIVNIIGDVIFTILGVYLAHTSIHMAIFYTIASEIMLYPYKANLLYLSVGSLRK